MIAEKPKSQLGIAHTRWATHGSHQKKTHTLTNPMKESILFTMALLKII